MCNDRSLQTEHFTKEKLCIIKHSNRKIIIIIVYIASSSTTIIIIIIIIVILIFLEGKFQQTKTSDKNPRQLGAREEFQQLVAICIPFFSYFFISNCFMNKLLLAFLYFFFINTEGTLRMPMTYDNHFIPTLFALQRPNAVTSYFSCNDFGQPANSNFYKMMIEQNGVYFRNVINLVHVQYTDHYLHFIIAPTITTYYTVGSCFCLKCLFKIV